MRATDVRGISSRDGANGLAGALGRLRRPGPRGFAVGAACLVLALPLLLYPFGLRVLVVRPIGLIPNGLTVVTMGSPGLRAVDSPDAFCTRTAGSVSLPCRGMLLATVGNNGRILLRLPYLAPLDWLARTPPATL